MEYPMIKIANGNTITISKTQLINLEGVSLALRSEGGLKGRAIYLPKTVGMFKVDEWVIAEDNLDHLCAVPLLSKESS